MDTATAFMGMNNYRFLSKINPKDTNLLPIHVSPNVLENISDAISCWNSNTMNGQRISL